jgi:hypothetical protein
VQEVRLHHCSACRACASVGKTQYCNDWLHNDRPSLTNAHTSSRVRPAEPGPTHDFKPEQMLRHFRTIANCNIHNSSPRAALENFRTPKEAWRDYPVRSDKYTTSYYQKVSKLVMVASVKPENGHSTT